MALFITSFMGRDLISEFRIVNPIFLVDTATEFRFFEQRKEKNMTRLSDTPEEMQKQKWLEGGFLQTERSAWDKLVVALNDLSAPLGIKRLTIESLMFSQVGYDDEEADFAVEYISNRLELGKNK